MISKEVLINNQVGLHARPATFFIQKDNEIYRIVNPADWAFEGGFNIYVLETFVGDSDEQKPDEDVDLGNYL